MILTLEVFRVIRILLSLKCQANQLSKRQHRVISDNQDSQFRSYILERETRFELATFCLGSRHSTTELLPHSGDLASKCSQVFTKSGLEAFLASRASGTSPKTIRLYHTALDNFVGYQLTPEGINFYLNSLTCKNGKHNYYRVILPGYKDNVSLDVSYQSDTIESH